MRLSSRSGKQHLVLRSNFIEIGSTGPAGEVARVEQPVAASSNVHNDAARGAKSQQSCQSEGDIVSVNYRLKLIESQLF